MMKSATGRALWRRTRGARWPVAVLAGVALAFVAPEMLRGEVLDPTSVPARIDPAFETQVPASRNPLAFDSAYVFGPDLREVRRQLADGHLPLWNSGLAGGRPLLASQQHGATFPLTWPALVLPQDWTLTVLLAVKLLLAALGLYLFARSLGLGTVGGVVAGLAFGCGSYIFDWAQHPQVNVYLLVPWMFLVARRIGRDARVLDGGALGALFGLALLGGHPQSALLVGVPAVAFAFATAWTRRYLAGAPRPRSIGLVLALAGLIGLALGAVALVPFVEALRVSDGSERGSSGLPWESLLSVVAPNFQGRPTWTSADFSDVANYAERTVYIGCIPLALAIVGGRYGRGRERRFFFYLILAALAFALDLPAVHTLAELPGIDAVNADRAIVLAVFAACVLAGYGAEALNRLTGPQYARAVRLFGLTIGLSLVPVLVEPHDIAAWPRALAGLPDAMYDPLDRSVVAARDEIAWVVLATLGWLAIRRRPRWAIVIGLIAVDLVAVNRGYHPFEEAGRTQQPSPTVVRALRETNTTHQRVAGLGGALAPNLALDYGLRDLRGHDHPPIARTKRLWSAFYGLTEARLDIATAGGPEISKLTALFAVRRVVVPNGVAVPPGMREVEKTQSGLTVVEHAETLPRAWLASSVTGAKSEEAALEAVRELPISALRELPVVEGSPPRLGAGETGSVRFLRDDPGEVVLRVSAPARRLLVLADVDYPGWYGEIDGESATIRAANLAFRSVVVPPGTHTVRFAYRPTSFRIGFILSALTALGLLVALIVRRRAAAERM